MPRPMWKGTISFGLVSIPVLLFSSVQKNDVSFHMLSKDGSCRLRRKLYCPETGEEYDFQDTARGVEIAPEQYVLVQQDEIEQLKPDGGRTIDIEDFVELEQIDPIFYDRTYYIAPDERGAKPYSLLVQAMTKKNRVGIARFIMRSNEYLGALRVMDDGQTIALETMHYAEDIRSREELEIPEEAEASKKELELALQLIETFSEDFKPEKYRNEYRQRVADLIEQKTEGRELVLPETADKETKVVDLMEALKRSVAERRSSGNAKSKKQSTSSEGRATKKGGGKTSAGRKKRASG